MKTLYIDIDEEMTDITQKVGQLNAKHILLVIPKGAQIFSNSVNLKVLQQKAKKEEKMLKIFTNDEKGRKMTQKAGIVLYEGPMRKRQLSTSAQLGNLPHKKVEKLQQKRVSITDISRQSSDSSKKVLSSPKKKIKKKEQRDWAQFFLFNTIKKRTVLLFTGITIGVFALVLYVAIPSATIYLEPATNVVEKTINITLADPNAHRDLFRQPNNHTIPAMPIEQTFSKEIVYTSTGKVFTGTSASCKLKVTNDRTSPWSLVTETRFKDPTGVIFRLRDGVEVPAARFQVVRDEEGNAERQKVSGTLLVTVTADDKDENGAIIGARGNLPDQTAFILPGLSPFNQTLLSAVSEGPCTGGQTDFYGVVTEDDILASEKKIEEVLRDSAKQLLIDTVENENLARAQESGKEQPDVKIALFDNPRAMLFELKGVEIPSNLQGSRTEEFSVSGTMWVKGIAYEEPSYYEILEQGLVSKVHPDKVLSKLDFDSTTYNIVNSDSDLDDLSKVKISVTVRGLEEFNFDPQSEAGKEIIDRIMGYVPGKSKPEALYFISNLEQIQRANISIWPFWKQDIPERVPSITIRVR